MAIGTKKPTFEQIVKPSFEELVGQEEIPKTIYAQPVPPEEQELRGPQFRTTPEDIRPPYAAPEGTPMRIGPAEHPAKPSGWDYASPIERFMLAINPPVVETVIGKVERTIKQFWNKGIVDVAHGLGESDNPALIKAYEIQRSRMSNRRKAGKRLHSSLLDDEFKDITWQLGLKPGARDDDDLKNISDVYPVGEDVNPFPKFNIPPGQDAGDYIADTVAGIGSFVGQIYFLKKTLPGAPSQMIWEIQNVATGGKPGRGAAINTMLQAISHIPTTSVVGKGAKVVAGGGLFGGLTYAAGGDFTDIAVNTAIGAGFQAWDIHKQNQWLKSFKSHLKKAEYAKAQKAIAKGNKQAREVYQKDLARGMKQVDANFEYQRNLREATRIGERMLKGIEPKIDKAMDVISRRLHHGKLTGKEGELATKIVERGLSPKVVAEVAGVKLPKTSGQELAKKGYSKTERLFKLKPAKGSPAARIEAGQTIQVVRNAEGSIRAYYPTEFKLDLPTGWTVGIESLPEAALKIRLQEVATQKAKEQETLLSEARAEAEVAEMDTELKEIQRQATEPTPAVRPLPSERISPPEAEIARPGEVAEAEKPRKPLKPQEVTAKKEKYTPEIPPTVEPTVEPIIEVGEMMGMAYLLDDGTILKDMGAVSHIDLARKIPEGKKVVDAGFLDAEGNYLMRDKVISRGKIHSFVEPDGTVVRAKIVADDVRPEMLMDGITIEMPNGERFNIEREQLLKPIEKQFEDRLEQWENRKSLSKHPMIQKEFTETKPVLKPAEPAVEKPIPSLAEKVKKAVLTEPELTKKEIRQREIEAETEEAGISPQRRNRIMREIAAEIKESDIYQAELEGLETKIGPGYYFVPETFRGEVEDIIGKRKGGLTKIQKMFTFDPHAKIIVDTPEGKREIGPLPWETAVQQALGRGKEGVEETWGEMDISDFVQQVKDSAEATEDKYGLSQTALDKISQRREEDPYELYRIAKFEMLREGRTVTEIDEMTKEWAEHYGLDEAEIENEFLGAEPLKLKEIKKLPEAEQETAIEALARENVLKQERQEAKQAVNDVLKANDIEVEVEEVAEIKEGEEIPFERRGKPTGAAIITPAGREIVQLAYGADSETGYHEAYHTLRRHLTPKDRKVLDMRFKGDTEAEAREFAEFAKTGKATGYLRGIWRKLVEKLKKIKSALQGRGYRTAQDIFGEIQRGVVPKEGAAPGATQYERGVFGQPIQEQLRLPLPERQAAIKKVAVQEARTKVAKKKAKPYEEWRPKGRVPIKTALIKAVDAEIARTMKPRSNTVNITPEEIATRLRPPTGLFVAKQKGPRKTDLFYEPDNPLPEITEAFNQLVKGGPLIQFERRPVFYSKLERVVSEKMPNKMQAYQFENWLKKQGIKKEELDWSGLTQYLRGGGTLMGKWKAADIKRTVTKQEILDTIAANNIQIEEVEKGELTQEGAITGELRQARLDELQDEKDWYERRIDKAPDKESKEVDDYRKHLEDIEAEIEGLEELPEGATKFQQYVLPGGERYRELLLRLPEPALPEPTVEQKRRYDALVQGERIDSLTDAQRRELNNLRYEKSEEVYKSGHWEETNVLAHVRFNERTDSEGKKVLFIEELQSDWHQAGRRKGYKQGYTKDELSLNTDEEISTDIRERFWVIDAPGQVFQILKREHPTLENAMDYIVAEKDRFGGVPDAPFKKTWHELTLKRMLRYAAENGYDKLAWTTGEQQAERYDLSKHVDEVGWNPDTKLLVAKKGGETLIREEVEGDKLDDYVGKEAAAKLKSSKYETAPDQTAVRVLRGMDLKVGGGGMKSFYDKMIPSFLNKYAKKWGARVGTAKFVIPKTKVEGAKLHMAQTLSTPAIDITPSMKKSVMAGQVQFETSGDRMVRESMRNARIKAEKERLKAIAKPKKKKAPGLRRRKLKIRPPGVPYWQAEVGPEGEVEFVKGPPGATQEQKTRINDLAIAKGMISERGKLTPRYRKFAKVVTGKSNIDQMTQDEVEQLADMLDLLTVDYRGIARIPSPMDVISKELLTELKTKLPELKTIGFLERFRESKRVFQKMGLGKEVFEPAFEAEISSMEELFDFRKQAKQMRKSVGKDKITAERLFNALENPGSVKLSENEKTVVGWAKNFFDDWADRLALPPEARRKDYITHIFEKDIAEQLKEKHPIDPDLIRALDFITPQTIFNPFLQKRLGKTTGLKRDLWAAMQAYEFRAIKKFYYEPLIKRIRIYEKFLPPSSARYLRNYITRISGRPLVIDREINQTLKEAGEQIAKLPGGAKLAQYLTKGNASGMLAYNMAGLYYEAWLGLRPASAIKNLSQHGLALAEAGPVAFSRAMKTIGKKRTDLLSHSRVLRSRQSGYLPGIDQTFIKSLESKRRKVEMFMFRAADRKNVSDAFLSGYYEAKAKGLSDEWAYKRGDEVAAKTQYLYSKLAGSQFTQSAPGRILGVLTTWPRNWAELMNDWIQGKPSEVYQDYEKQTGEKITPTNWVARRKSLWTYLSLVGTAKLVEKGTPIKAMYYTGWTSIRSMQKILSGQLPGLELPATILLLVAGLTLGDKKLLKQAWNRIKRFWVIQKEIRDVISGKKDWLNLFIYLEKKKEPEEWSEATD